MANEDTKMVAHIDRTAHQWCAIRLDHEHQVPPACRQHNHYLVKWEIELREVLQW